MNETKKILICKSNNVKCEYYNEYNATCTIGNVEDCCDAEEETNENETILLQDDNEREFGEINVPFKCDHSLSQEEEGIIDDLIIEQFPDVIFTWRWYNGDAQKPYIIIMEFSESNQIECPYCEIKYDDDDLDNFGQDPNGLQRFYCSGCEKEFMVHNYHKKNQYSSK